MSRQRHGDQLLKAVDEHLRRLGWTTSDLARQSGLTPSLFTEWRQRQRSVQAHQVNRVAIAIARGYDELLEENPVGPSDKSRRARDGRAHPPERAPTDRPSAMLHVLLEELLRAAGFLPPTHQGVHNPVVNRLRRLEPGARELRVGFFRWDGLSAPKSGEAADGADNPTKNGRADGPRASGEPDEAAWEGLAVDIARLVGSLMGVRVRCTAVSWPHVHRSLEDGSVDLVGPVYLRVPMRMFNVRLSDPVPNLRCRLVGVCNAERLRQVCVREGMSLPEPGKPIERLLMDCLRERIRWIIGESEVTEALMRFLDVFVPDERIDRTTPVREIMDGVRAAVLGDAPDGVLTVFPTEMITARHALRADAMLRDATAFIPGHPTDAPLTTLAAALRDKDALERERRGVRHDLDNAVRQAEQREQSARKALLAARESSAWDDEPPVGLDLCFAARLEDKDLVRMVNESLRIIGSNEHWLSGIVDRRDAQLGRLLTEAGLLQSPAWGG